MRDEGISTLDVVRLGVPRWMSISHLSEDVAQIVSLTLLPSLPAPRPMGAQAVPRNRSTIGA
jgi:hypothetical protein